ncbi:MAG: branched-chain amino acid aminotransferase [Deltaproteobacteria bacterium]|nr:branched-chain amino acid aminotransferase [Deltaproteobacteria bacterium]
MQISIQKRSVEDLKTKPEFNSNLGFGKFFTDHMFIMDYRNNKWINPRIVPHGVLSLDPSAMCFHYGQEIFEGMKVFRGTDESVIFFRSMDNFRRMNNSAARMEMPEVDIDVVTEGLRELVKLDKSWIPNQKGYSLYIRPTMIATEGVLGVRPSDEYMFFIIACPVASFFPEQQGKLKPVKIFVSTQYVRAAPGGTGSAKVAGNYAASLKAQVQARKFNCQQVMWLDGIEHRYVEEVGTMNIFAVFNDTLVTSPLTGTILPGITRDSVMVLAKHLGIEVVERRFTIEELLSGMKDKTVSEVFGSGTAAIISPVSSMIYKEQSHVVGNGETGPVAEKIYNALLDIQYGQAEDPFGWTTVLK